MVAAGIADHPAAEFCVNLSIGGLTDWYLAARWEWDIAYFHLKPTTASNNTSWGDNPYSVPRRNSKYTADNPAQTGVAAFALNQSEAFVDNTHWTSFENSSAASWRFSFATGAQLQFGGLKQNAERVRAFRRVAL
jgi:hypothetical protein